MYALGNYFHHIKNFYQNNRFAMEEENDGELEFFGVFLRRKDEDIFVLVYGSPAQTDPYLCCSSHQVKGCKERVFYIINY